VGNIYTILEGILREKIVEFDVAGIILECILKKEVACMWMAIISLKAECRGIML
jgi:hypothetical protein